MSALYNRFLKVLSKWPVDKTKAGRDLGEHLRDQFKHICDADFVVGNKTRPNLAVQLESLERILNNTALTKYKRLHASTATGLNGEQCNQILSSEFLNYMNEEKGIFSK